MPDRDRRSVRHRQARARRRVRETAGEGLGLTAAARRERRIGLALEAALGDPRRFAVPYEGQHEGGGRVG
jgi:hypothetical protein